MSLEEIKTEVTGMSQEQQDQLAAYLVHLRHQRDRRIREEITAGIDDKARIRFSSSKSGG